METIDKERFSKIIDSDGLTLSSYYLFQIDLTEDGIG